MAEAAGWPRTVTDRSLRAMLGAVRASLKRGDAVTLVGFGTFSVAPPPIFTPRLRTIWVSNGLVSMATRNPHSGQRKVTVSEPSSGPAVSCSFIG